MTAMMILARLPAHPSLGEAAEFMGTGLFLVVGVLTLLAVMIGIIGFAFRAMNSRTKAGRTTPHGPPDDPGVAAPVPAAESPVMEAGADLISAVIVAAVHAAMAGQPHRIVTVQARDENWAREGRRSIFASHTFR